MRAQSPEGYSIINLDAALRPLRFGFETFCQRV